MDADNKKKIQQPRVLSKKTMRRKSKVDDKKRQVTDVKNITKRQTKQKRGYLWGHGV